MNTVKSNWENILKIITVITTVTTVIFAYLAIRSSRQIANEQIQFNKDIHNQDIKMNRPLISFAGNIGIFDTKIYNLNIAMKNSGKRTLYNLRIKYWVLVKESNDFKIIFHKEYQTANQLDSGAELIFFERLPRTNLKNIIYYKIFCDYTDSLTNIKYTQDSYYILPVEQQYYLDKNIKKTIGLFSALVVDEEIINKNIQ